jgi:hypothetical protein
MEVISGKVLSARSYSIAHSFIYDNKWKSMQISSGPSPMAYVLSSNKNIALLLKFNPLSFSPPVWKKQASLGNCNCGLGLILGKDQN